MRRLVLIGAAVAALVAALAAGAFLLLGFLLRDPAEELMGRAEALRKTGESLMMGRGGEGVEPRATSGRNGIGLIEEAADLFGQVSLIAPESSRAPEALFEMGFTYYVIVLPKVPGDRQGEKRRMAEMAFCKLIERYPDSPLVPQARLFLSEIFMANAEAPSAMDAGEQYGKALEQYEAVVGQVSDLEERQAVFFNMACCYERLGRFETAIRCLEEIVDLSREGRYFENAHLMLARYYAGAGLHERAVEQLNLLLLSRVSFPTSQDARTRLVESLLQLKRFDEAKAALKEVRETSSNRALIEDYRDRIRRWSMEGGAS